MTLGLVNQRPAYGISDATTHDNLRLLRLLLGLADGAQMGERPPFFTSIVAVGIGKAPASADSLPVDGAGASAEHEDHHGADHEAHDHEHPAEATESDSDESDEDAVTALGYVHAQDRLWQMELMRRIAPGRLSELFGN